MARIFLGLAFADFLLLTLALVVGVVSFLRGAAASGSDTTYLWHFTLGLFSVLLNLGVHCLIFIYFLGTGRWVKEVALAYRLPDEPWPRQTRELKRRTFPVALLAMLVPIGAAASGSGVQLTGWPWQVHAAFAALTLLVNAWAFRVEYRNVSVNSGIIDAVLREVDRIRVAQGLPSNAEALQQEEL